MDIQPINTDLSDDVVYGLAVHESRSDEKSVSVCFAATSLGLMVSTNGKDWNNAYHSLNISEELTTTSVVVSPDFADDKTVIAGVSGGVLRSEDGGGKWLTILFPQPLPVISCLAISPNFRVDGIVFAGTMEDGVFFSSDQGAHWASWNFGLLDLNVLCLAPSPSFEKDETIFAGTESGMFKSTNGGRAWKELILPIGYVPVISLATSPKFEKDHTLFCGTEENGLWRSTDGGKTWLRVGENQLIDPVNSILVSPYFDKDGTIFSIVGGAVFRSNDGGDTWRQEELGAPDEEITTAFLTGGHSFWWGVVGAKVYQCKIN